MKSGKNETSDKSGDLWKSRMAKLMQRRDPDKLECLIPRLEAKPPRRGSDYQRDPSHDPHLPHTTHYREHPDLQIPPEAQAVIDQMWPEVVRTFQQWDNESGMLMLYRCVRDACAAAGWDNSMAYLMRDHLITLLNKSKVRTLKGGSFRDAKIKPEPYGEGIDSLIPPVE